MVDFTHPASLWARSLDTQPTKSVWRVYCTCRWGSHKCFYDPSDRFARDLHHGQRTQPRQLCNLYNLSYFFWGRFCYSYPSLTYPASPCQSGAWQGLLSYSYLSLQRQISLVQPPFIRGALQESYFYSYPLSVIAHPSLHQSQGQRGWIPYGYVLAMAVWVFLRVFCIIKAVSRHATDRCSHVPLLTRWWLPDPSFVSWIFVFDASVPHVLFDIFLVINFWWVLFSLSINLLSNFF